MPYVKPGVEIQQVEKSQSPVLITPELEAVILGTAYHYQDPYSESSKCTNKLVIDAAGSAGTDATFDVGALGYSISDNSQVIADLVCVKGANVGRRFHAKSTDISVASNVITVSQTASGVDYDSSISFADGDEFIVYVGFVAEKTSANKHLVMESLSDVREYLGEPKTFNPLGYGALVCMLNAGSKINTFGHVGSEKADQHLADLELKDVFAIAGMDQDSDPANYKSHVENQSEPTSKHERVAFVNVPRPSEIADGLTSTQRNTNATTIQQANSAIGSKRVYSIHPDRGYVLESRHVSTIRPTWIVASFASTAATTIATGIHDEAILSAPVILSDGTKYPAGTKIDNTVWSALVKDGWGELSEVNVYVPIPGYYYAAAIAGAAIGTPVEQPLTYYSVSGVSRTYGSLDMFSEGNLNTMAEGGTFIMVQDSQDSPIYVRHQLSTDVTSIERREFSIVRQADYAAKYIRKVLNKYAGKYNITPNFLKLVEANLRGIGRDLVVSGKLAAMEVIKVYQDDISPDTVRAEVEITVKYPANYIKILLII